MRTTVVATVIAFVVLAIMAALLRHRWSAVCGTVCVAAAAAGIAVLLASPAARAAPLAGLAQQHAEVRARIEIRDDPQLRTGRVRGQVRGSDEYVAAARVLAVEDHGHV